MLEIQPGSQPPHMSKGITMNKRTTSNIIKALIMYLQQQWSIFPHSQMLSLYIRMFTIVLRVEGRKVKSGHFVVLEFTWGRTLLLRQDIG